MVKVAYSFEMPARVTGTMEIPQEIIDRIPPDVSWSLEIEQYILRNVDFQNNPPEFFEEDAEFIKVMKAQNETSN